MTSNYRKSKREAEDDSTDPSHGGSSKRKIPTHHLTWDESDISGKPESKWHRNKLTKKETGEFIDHEALKGKRRRSPSTSPTRKKHKHKKSRRLSEHKSRKHSYSGKKPHSQRKLPKSEREQQKREKQRQIGNYTTTEEVDSSKSTEIRTYFYEHAKEKESTKEKRGSKEEYKIRPRFYRLSPKKIVISSRLQRKIEDILRTELHHVISKKCLHGSIQHVEWCYYYLDPKLPGHIPGGRARLHHFCRVCKRTCLHLLGKYGTRDRKCLACAAQEMGWKEKEVPSWYFHTRCGHCQNDSRRRQFRYNR